MLRDQASREEERRQQPTAEQRRQQHRRQQQMTHSECPPQKLNEQRRQQQCRLQRQPLACVERRRQQSSAIHDSANAAAGLLRHRTDAQATTSWEFVPPPSISDPVASSSSDEADDEPDVPLGCMLAPGAICPLVCAPKTALALALQLARVGPSDVLLDLGCGDGRLLVMAARLGATAIGVDVNPHCLKLSRARAKASGLADRIEVYKHDLTKIMEHPRYQATTVIYAYLMPKPIAALEPMLRAAVHAGKRVAIFCTSGLTAKPGNCIGDLVPSAEGCLGMVRVFG